MERRDADRRRYRSSRSEPVQPALAEATVEVVRPGDRVRISNVLDVVLPDVRVTTRPTFPGALGIRRLDGPARRRACSRSATGQRPATSERRRAARTPSSTWPARRADRSPVGRDRERRRAVRAGAGAPRGRRRSRGARVASAAARARRSRRRRSAPTPDAVDAVRAARLRPTATLPAVAVVLQVASEGPLADTFLDGEPLGGLDADVLDERGARSAARSTNGAYDWPGVRNVTATYQDRALDPRAAASATATRAAVRRARARARLPRHGASRSSAPPKLSARARRRRSAPTAAVCTTFSRGNSHTDTMLTVQALRARGASRRWRSCARRTAGSPTTCPRPTAS